MDFNSEQWVAWGHLMEQIQEGDMDAYARLLSEMSPLVFNYVRKRVFNPAQVEDIYQDVLLTFHKARHTYQTDRPFSPWLFAIVRNAVWNALSRRRKFTDREVYPEEMPDAAGAPAGDEGLDDRLHLALGSLSENNRRAVEMLKLEGRDLESAARELGISKIALKVRAHRGYAQLRKILSGDN